MKKLLAITLTLCMIFSVLMVAPVSAEMVEKQITPVSAAFTANQISDTDNQVAAIIDGQESTMAIVDGYNNHMYIDLGEAYQVTKIEVVYPTSDAITAYLANVTCDHDASTMNTQTQVRLGTTVPSGTWGNRINASVGVGKTGTVTTYSTDGYTTDGTSDMNIRYISFTQGTSSNPTAVAEVRVYAMVEETETPDTPVGPTQTVEKQITPVSAAFTANQISDTDNQVAAIIDGQESTMAIVDGYNNHMYIDLGEAYQVTKIEVVYPTSDAITAYLANVTCDHDASTMNTQTQVRLGTTVPSGTWGNRINASVGVGKTGEVTTYSTDGYTTDGTSDMNIRYISFTQGTSSNPTAVAEVRVYAMVEEEIVVEADITSTKIQYGVEDLNLALDATITAEYQNGGSNYATYDHSYLIDNDPSTVALIGGRAVYSSSTAATPAIVILDLGESRYLTNVKLDPIAENAESDFVAGLNVGNISNAANVNDGVHVYLSDTLPTYANPGTQLSTSQLATAENSNYTLDGTVAYRYVALKSLAGSYPGAFSGITIKDTTENPEKLRFFFTATHNIATPASFGAYITPFSLLGEGEESNADSVIVENTDDAALLTSGSTYAVDLTGIPAEGYDKSILALPFVSYDGVYYYGTAVTTTVNDVLAAQ